MFLKESLSIFAFMTSTLGISGFAIKIDKFEYNYLALNKLNLSIESYRKLNLKKGDNFYYFENEKSKLSKINDIQIMSPKTSQETEYIQLVLESKNYQKLNNQETDFFSNGKLIKYFLESKPFWINLFG